MPGKEYKMETIQMWEKTPGRCEEIPVLEYYPAKEKKSDTTVVILPGGGYCGRAGHEGKGYAEYLNAAGFDTFVCEYRVHPSSFPIPLLDARRAVRLVRYYADKYGVNKNKICIMGSSAGGHLAALTSTYTDPIDFEGMDEIDNEDFLPNGTILCYPVITFIDDRICHQGSRENLLHCTDREMYKKTSPEALVTEKTPPAFIWHTAADGGVNVINSYMYATALREEGIPCEMHIFPFGGHGMGTADGEPHVHQWTELLVNWLKYMF